MIPNKKYRICLMDKYPISIEEQIKIAKREMFEDIFNDISSNAFNSFKFDISQDEITLNKYLNCTVYNIQEDVSVVVPLKTPTPPTSIRNIKDLNKPKFFTRLKASLGFLFKEDKGYFEVYCSSHIKEIEQLDKLYKKIKGEQKDGR